MIGRRNKHDEHRVKVEARRDAILDALAELRAVDVNAHARLCDVIASQDRERRMTAKRSATVRVTPVQKVDRRAPAETSITIPGEDVPGLFGDRQI